MENENIEIVESEVIENEEIIGDMEDILEYSRSGGKDDSSIDNSSFSDFSIEQSDKSLEDLLKEYFIDKGVVENGSNENSSVGSSYNNSDVGSSVFDYTDLINEFIDVTQDQANLESSVENGSNENSSVGSSYNNSDVGSSVFDYTDLINELIDVTQDQANLESSLLSYYEEYEQNNSLDSPINSISLSNFLIFIVFVGVLFCATIFFARRFD